MTWDGSGRKSITWRMGEAGAPVTVASLPARGRPPEAAARRAGLDPVTVAALRRHRARQLEHKLAVGARYVESGLVFTWLDGSPIHPLRFSRWFEQHARRAGLPKIRLHDLRHSYASAALGRGRLRRSGPPRPGTDRPAGHGKADPGLGPCMP
jgi:integrase